MILENSEYSVKDINIWEFQFMNYNLHNDKKLKDKKEVI